MNLKQKLSKKLKKTGGFTLIEMLIVVAIIAILVAVSIPMVNANLEKAREATDAANERAAKAAAMVYFMSNPPASDAVIAYDYGSDGTIVVGTVDTAVTGDIYKYGQGTASGDVITSRAGKYVQVQITPSTGVAEIKWLPTT